MRILNIIEHCYFRFPLGFENFNCFFQQEFENLAKRDFRSFEIIDSNFEMDLVLKRGFYSKVYSQVELKKSYWMNWHCCFKLFIMLTKHYFYQFHLAVENLCLDSLVGFLPPLSCIYCKVLRFCSINYFDFFSGQLFGYLVFSAN